MAKDEFGFDDAVIKILTKKENTIVDADKDLLKSLTPIEDKIFEAVRRQVSKMNKDGDNLVFDDKNVDLLNEVDQIIVKQLKAYAPDVKQYLRNFETIKEFNFDVQKSVNDLSQKELEDLINPIQKAITQQTIDGLTGSGVNTSFIEPVKQGIFKNIVAGSTITDLESALRTWITTTQSGNSLLRRYVTQVSRDALNQFDGQVNSKIAQEYELDAFRYVGSLIDDSRAQCIRWSGKGVVLKEELEKEISWAISNGTGMIPGTNKETFATYRGGYNCRHSAIPFKMTPSMKKKFLKEQEGQATQEAKPEQSQVFKPRAEQEIKDLYTYKSSKTPKDLENLQGLPQVLFDLSDNGTFERGTDRVKADGAFYSPTTQKVVVGKGSRYSSNEALRKVVVHEYGHRLHFVRKLYGYNIDYNQQIAESTFLKAKKLVSDKLKNDSTFKDRITNLKTLFDSNISQFDKQMTKSEIEEFTAAYTDTIEALTGGKYGFGHGKKYQTQSRGAMARMEFFAHASENYFLDNPIFRKEFPELFDLMNEYYSEEVVKKYIDPNLLK
jgi:hypothetical protein